MNVDESLVLQGILYSVRGSYILGLFSLLVAKIYLPNFLEYGKTLKNKRSQSNSWINEVINLTVPKAWFAHFYIISTFLSVITLICYKDYAIVWVILMHSIRRLYETIHICKYTEKSRMNWSHYIVGIWFYTVLHTILNIELYQGRISKHLNKKSFLLFFLASWDQYQNHKVLSQLIKYSLPTKRLFKYVCCPHYLDEILIYASLTTYSPKLFWPLIWVVASLTVSAFETRKYYIIKFKDKKVASYSIIPFFF